MYLSDVTTISTWFLSKQPMNEKRLQQLLYYSYAWTLAYYNKDSDSLDTFLFEDKFEAWAFGPKIRALFEKYGEKGLLGGGKQQLLEN